MRVLAADDNDFTLRMLTLNLEKWGFDVVAAKDGHEALAALRDPDGPRLALLDWMMPGLDGLDVCREIRSVEGLPHRYLIMLTSRDAAEDIVEGLRGGADDYVVKTWTPAILRARLDVGRRMIELHRALEETARFDALTGVLNRRALMEHLVAERSRSRREEKPLAILMIDVDRFKQVNDTHGHLVGDRVLEEVALRLCATCRRYDTVGRYGGEEFTIIAPGVPEDALPTFAERCRRSVVARPVSEGELTLDVTVSVGGVWAAHDDERPVRELLAAADLRLYQAKELGRNRSVCTET